MNVDSCDGRGFVSVGSVVVGCVGCVKCGFEKSNKLCVRCSNNEYRRGWRVNVRNGELVVMEWDVCWGCSVEYEREKIIFAFGS